MGRLVLICRLAARDLRRRPGEAVLLLLAIVAATTTLTLGLLLHGVTSHPYDTTRAETAGPDVVANVTPLPNGKPADLAALRALTRVHGVAGHSGPYPLIQGVARRDGHAAAVQLEGRDSAPASVDQPKLTQGSWVRPGGVVVERSFADAFNLRPGDRITLGERPFQVVGLAVTAAMSPYPFMSCLTPCGLGAAGPQTRALWSRATSRAHLDHACRSQPCRWTGGVPVVLVEPDAGQSGRGAGVRR